MPAPYTHAEILVLSSGAVGLLAAIAVPGQRAARTAAYAVSKYNRRRFHPRTK